MSATKVQKAIWKDHVDAALAHPGGVREYCLEQKISKSALYRWKTIFSNKADKVNLAKSIKVKNKNLNFKKPLSPQSSSFLPVIVERDIKLNSTQTKSNNLPDSAWLGEVLVKVIQGLS